MRETPTDASDIDSLYRSRPSPHELDDSGSVAELPGFGWSGRTCSTRRHARVRADGKLGCGGGHAPLSRSVGDADKAHTRGVAWPRGRCCSPGGRPRRSGRRRRRSRRQRTHSRRNSSWGRAALRWSRSCATNPRFSDSAKVACPVFSFVCRSSKKYGQVKRRRRLAFSVVGCPRESDSCQTRGGSQEAGCLSSLPWPRRKNRKGRARRAGPTAETKSGGTQGAQL